MYFILPLLMAFAGGRKTIIISSDGFRWDYYGRIPTPGIDQIRMNGVQVKNLINPFATLTFPNHFTLVTGLYEENHGIVDNEMYDPHFNETFNMGTIDPKWWQEAEPIWVTAAKDGKKSVCVNWVGCSIPIQGIRPAYWGPYDGTIKYNARVDKVADSINGDAELGLLYFEEPDHSAHQYGPDSSEVDEGIVKVDQAIQYLLTKVDLGNVNIIFTADHGATAVSKDRIIVLDSFTDLKFNLVASGAVAHIWHTGDESNSNRILEDLNNIDRNIAKCYLRDDIPNRLRYSKNSRIAPVVCIAELGWTLVKSRVDQEQFTMKGSHGYDSTTDESSPMRPVFVAGGPSFKRTPVESIPEKPFESVHVFPLLIRLLDIKPEIAPLVDGEEDPISGVLCDAVDLTAMKPETPPKHSDIYSFHLA